MRAVTSRWIARFRAFFRSRRRPEVGLPTDAELAAAAGRCTGCGACDLAYVGYERMPRPSFRGPSDLALTIGRSPDDVEAVRDLAMRLDDASLTRAQVACPEAVPLVDIARVRTMMGEKARAK